MIFLSKWVICRFQPLYLQISQQLRHQLEVWIAIEDSELFRGLGRWVKGATSQFGGGSRLFHNKSSRKTHFQPGFKK